MNLSKIALAMGIGFSMVSGFANAETSGTQTPAAGGNHGVIHFKGEITDSPCSLDADSADQTVDLGQVSSSKLKDGGTSDATFFNIVLKDCDVDSVGKTVSATWSGIADASLPTAWGISGEATGAGIVLHDNSEQTINVGDTVSLGEIAKGDNTIVMSAFLKGDGQTIVPGTFESAANFQLSYQ
ncbi:TPA: fimbrial protein [Salmonella enterica]